MDKIFVILIAILVILGLFYMGERIVKETKLNPNESDTTLVGKGLAKSGTDAYDTIKNIIDYNSKSSNITTKNITNATPQKTLINIT